MIFSKVFPELERLPTGEARRKAAGRAIRAVTSHWLYWVAVAGIAGAEVVIQFKLPRLIPMAWRGTVRWLVVALTLFACWALILSFKKTIRRTLWGALVEHGIPCCGSCGYDLKGNLSGTCPECGTEVRQR